MQTWSIKMLTNKQILLVEKQTEWRDTAHKKPDTAHWLPLLKRFIHDQLNEECVARTANKAKIKKWLKVVQKHHQNEHWQWHNGLAIHFNKEWGTSNSPKAD